MSQFRKLEAHLNEMEDYIPLFQARDLNVSQVNVGWHLAHSFKVINIISASLKASEPNKFQRKFNLKRFLVLMLGYIPRGKAQSPNVALPEEVHQFEDLLKALETARENLDQFDSLQKNNYFYHPYLREMNKKQSLRLLEVHTKHHLKIIRDILR